MSKHQAHVGRRVLAGLATGVAFVAIAGILPLPAGRSWAASGPQTPAVASTPAGQVAHGAVIVRAVPGGSARVASAVRSLGGTVTRELPIVDGFAATLPARAAARLASRTDVVSITPDASGHVMSVDPSLGYDPTGDLGSLYSVEQTIGATAAYRAGITGKGVDVALIDTGVAPVQGLTSGNVINGPDLSFDSQYPDARYKDGYGHGTHMASIIAGRDTVSSPAAYASPAGFHGIAPDARIISLKVGSSDGSADVSQVIAAIDWVTTHAHDNGLNIRVLNLSYGTDSTQDPRVDPLAFAAEAAWRKGILVVVAAGNDGTSNVALASPASDGNLLAVGAEDPNGTLPVADDTVPDFANRGTLQRHVDVVAPGVHILGLRDPNGLIDQTYPSARVGTRFFRGSGTSQATAVVSGAAALLFQRYPDMSPQQMKLVLGLGAQWLARGTVVNAGAGVVNVATTLTLTLGLVNSLPVKLTTGTYGTGLGSLEAARGSSHVDLDGVPLAGEQDIFGAAWKPAGWAPQSLAGTAWGADGSWNGNGWTGAGFDPAGNWSSRAWAGNSWNGTSWASRSWVGRTWVADGWSGRSWVADGWQGRTWVSAGWSSASWS